MLLHAGDVLVLPRLFLSSSPAGTASAPHIARSPRHTSLARRPVRRTAKARRRLFRMEDLCCAGSPRHRAFSPKPPPTRERARPGCSRARGRAHIPKLKNPILRATRAPGCAREPTSDAGPGPRALPRGVVRTPRGGTPILSAPSGARGCVWSGDRRTLASGPPLARLRPVIPPSARARALDHRFRAGWVPMGERHPPACRPIARACSRARLVPALPVLRHRARLRLFGTPRPSRPARCSASGAAHRLKRRVGSAAPAAQKNGRSPDRPKNPIWIREA